MSKRKVTDLEKKKQELEANLDRIQNGLDESIDKVKGGVVQNLNPKEVIRRYPLPVLAASVALGFLIGKPKSRTKTNNSGNNTFSSIVGSEVRNALTKKAVSVLLDMIDEQIATRKKPDQES